jgi:hypothetical protein
LPCTQWGALGDVPFNSDLGEEKLAAKSPSKWELDAMSLEVIAAYTQFPARFLDSE